MKKKWYEKGDSVKLKGRRNLNREEPPIEAQQLYHYRIECKETGGMDLECSMATALLTVQRLLAAAEDGRERSRSAHFEILKLDMAGLKKALETDGIDREQRRP